MQSDQEEEGQTRTPLEDVLLRRQQKQREVINPVCRFTRSSAMSMLYLNKQNMKHIAASSWVLKAMWQL